MVAGYDRNRDATRTLLAWLRGRYAVDPVIAAAIEALL